MTNMVLEEHMANMDLREAGDRQFDESGFLEATIIQYDMTVRHLQADLEEASQQLLNVRTVNEQLLQRLADRQAPPADPQPAPAAPLATPSEDATGQHFKAGDRVRIIELQAKPQLNGKFATVESFITSSGRYAIKLPDVSGRLLLRPSNLLIQHPFKIVITQDMALTHYRVTQFDVFPSNTIAEVETMVIESNQLSGLYHPSPTHANITFQGRKLSLNDTLSDIGVVAGSELMTTTYLDIGEWVTPQPGLASRLLNDPFAEQVERLTPDEVGEITGGLLQPFASHTPAYDWWSSMLSAHECEHLIQRLERDYATLVTGNEDIQRDLKVDLTHDELTTLIGQERLAVVIDAGAQRLSQLKVPLTSTHVRLTLRRRAAVDGTQYQVVPFHKDVSLVVVNVALNDGFQGGKILYVSEDRVLRPQRSTGCATVHDCSVVHGVTRLAAGIRYNLYAVFEKLKLSPAA
jgi:hypothetical protein